MCTVCVKGMKKKNKKIYVIFLVLFLQVVGNWFHEDDLGFAILCNLLYLEFPEVGRFNLYLATCDGNHAVLR